MEDLKNYLPDDAPEEDRRALEKIGLGFDALRLEQKVTAAAAARRQLARRRFLTKAVATALGLLLLGALAFWFFQKFSEKNDAPPADAPTNFEEKSSPKIEQPNLQPTTQPIENQIPVPAPLQPNLKETEPIAENPNPNFEEKLSRQISPTLRGENGNPDPARQALLDKIWRTEYPPAGMNFGEKFSEIDKLLRARAFSGAYVRLQRLERTLPANDTLIFMKGFCLLEMGEGAAALSNFDQLVSGQSQWQQPIRWLRGLGFLLAGRDDEALHSFKMAAGSVGDPFREDAQRAVRLLE